MGKTFAGSHKISSVKSKNSRDPNFSAVANSETPCSTYKASEQNGSFSHNEKSWIKTYGRKRNARNEILVRRNTCSNINDLYEYWCICRTLKPSDKCATINGHPKNDSSSIPRNINGTPRTSSNSFETFIPTFRIQSIDGNVTEAQATFERDKVSVGSQLIANGIDKFDDDISSTSDLKTPKNSQINILGKDLSETNGTGVIKIQDLFSKLGELNKSVDEVDNKQKTQLRSVDIPPGSSACGMDSASVYSSDHFDTSFCSLRSSDMMEPGNIADQLSLVQQMVVEMKTGFSKAMEELSKIQYSDETLQKQLANNKDHCNNEIDSLRKVVLELKNEVQHIGIHLQEVSDSQRSLHERLDTYQSDKDLLLEELEQSGAITNQTRQWLSGELIRENNNTIAADVAPMVHPYLNNLQQHHLRASDDQYNSDSSLRAAVARSLNLTQALGEKCANLDLSTTSSDEDNCRNAHSGTGHSAMKRHGSFQFEDINRASQKVPPHAQVLDGVHREEAVRNIVAIEREYCSQLWSLIEDYMNPLQQEEVISHREFCQMFPNYFQQLYEQHCIILRKLEGKLKHWRSIDVIGDVFARFTDSHDEEGLMLYKMFINDFPAIINTMNKCFTQSSHFREMMQSQCLANAAVLPLLLAPLQQVPKYSVLLKNVLKNTPEDHPDRYYLESSVTRLKQFLYNMNDDLEQAMQAINSNHPAVNRSREIEHSERSKSSASSGEVNHASRDFGVHSNEEERIKSPMSPNTARRHLLQVLHEKREQSIHRERKDSHPSAPRSRKQLGYGSHPDLPNMSSGAQDDRLSPYLAMLPQSKMFSSLSKLHQIPRDNSKKKTKSGKIAGARRLPSNINYLRPLTPQACSISASARSLENAKQKQEYAKQMQYRPASAAEYATHKHHDDYLEILAHQAGLTISSPNSSPSDWSQRELQLSLQKLLAETGQSVEECVDPDEDGNDGHISLLRRQILNTTHGISEKLDHEQQHRYNGTENNHLHEDFGVYGDDDEDEDDDNDADCKQEMTQPIHFHADSHRPKIMVPRWRQNASPQPPSYNQRVTNLSQQQNELNLEENLAVSLAQSLLDSSKQATTFPREHHSTNITQRDLQDENMDYSMKTYGSLKRNSPAIKMDSPRKSPASPFHENADFTCFGKDIKSVYSPMRPTDLDLNLVISGGHMHIRDSNGNSANNTAERVNKADDGASRSLLNSVTKLTDVIAYTTDCLEKSDANLKQEIGGNTMVKDSSILKINKPTGSRKLPLTDMMCHSKMQVSSVDQSSPMQLESVNMDSKQYQNSMASTTVAKESTFTNIAVNGYTFSNAAANGSTSATAAANGSTFSNAAANGSISATAAANGSTFSNAAANGSTSAIAAANGSTCSNAEANGSSFSKSSANGSISSNAANMDSVVFYFQNKSQINQNKVDETIKSGATSENNNSVGRLPTFINVDKTSTPVSEQKIFPVIKGTEKSLFGNFVKRESGRFVRGDEMKLDTQKSDDIVNSIKPEPVHSVDDVDAAKKSNVVKDTDKLQTNIASQKQVSEDNRQPLVKADATPMANLPIQKQFNEISKTGATNILDTKQSKSPDLKQAFFNTLPSHTNKALAIVSDSKENSQEKHMDLSESKLGLYKKGGPSKYQSESSTRYIQKLERSVSPNSQSDSPAGLKRPYDKSKSQAEPSSVTSPAKRGVSPQRGAKEITSIPVQCKSPSRASIERERPKSITDLETTPVNTKASIEAIGSSHNSPLKSALKETKIPVRKKSVDGMLSKSTEDISKMKKKTAFKDQIRNIFGRKKLQMVPLKQDLTMPSYTAEKIEII